MCYTPLATLLVGLRPAFLLAVLFLLAVTGAFFAQNAASLLIRGRAVRGTGFWLGVYVACVAAGILPLVLGYGLVDLLWIGLVGAGIFVRQTYEARAAHKRVDRTLGGELLAVGGLGLTAPGAYVVVTGAVDGMAVAVWLWVALYFISSVFYVKMLVAAAQVRETLNHRIRWRLGRSLGVYHLALTMALVVGVWRYWELWWVAFAYLPVLIRAFWGWFRLSNRMPPIKQVGVKEILYSLWFAGFSIAALSVLAP
jgi:hypothetical protein